MFYRTLKKGWWKSIKEENQIKGRCDVIFWKRSVKAVLLIAETPILAWPAVFCHFPFHSPVHPWLGLTSHTICHSSGGLFVGKAGQLGQLLWSGRCPLGAQIRSGSFSCVAKAKISTWWKAVEFISQSAAQTLFFFSSAASLGWDDCLMLLIMLDPSVFSNTCV